MTGDDAEGEPSESVADLFDEHAARARSDEPDPEETVDDRESLPDDDRGGEERGGFFDGEEDGDGDDDGDGSAVESARDVSTESSVGNGPGVEDEPKVEDEPGVAGEPGVQDEPGVGDDADASEARPAGGDRAAEADGVEAKGVLDAVPGAGTEGIDEGELDADDGEPTLAAGAAIDRAAPNDGRLSTGIDALDRQLGGGIPPGRIVSFVATADTQSELLVKHVASRHDCLYLSTLRPKWEVEEEVTDYVQKDGGRDTAGNSVHIEQLTADSRLDAARRHVEELERRTVVVIDSANELESHEKDRYVYFIDEVKRALWETGSVGLFYCIEEEGPPAGRAVTLRRADLIWQLRRTVASGEVSHQLLISKFRGGRALTEPLELSLTDEVGVGGGQGTP